MDVHSALILLLFVISIATMLVFARKNLWVAVFVAGCILSISTSRIDTIFVALQKTSTIENLFLSLALLQIPIIGKLLEKPLTESISRCDRRVGAAMGPAMFGLLSIPGGAILSSPLVDRIVGDDKSAEDKVALNIWFRHILFLVYPLSTALIVAVMLAHLDLIGTIIHMFPLLVLGVVVGYIYYLRGLSGGRNTGNKLYLGALVIVLIAPLIQLTMDALGIGMELGAFVGVTLTLVLSSTYTKTKLRNVVVIARKAKVWNFALIYLSIMFYGYVFAQTDVPGVISALSPPKILLAVILPFLIGFAVGRTQLTLTIMIPLYIGLFGAMDYLTLATMYTSTLAGYLMSPAHPCLVLTVEYFKADLYGSIKKIFVPSALLTLFATIYMML